MQKGFNCYHFIPANRTGFLDKIRDFSKYNNFKIIIDLEDSITDVFDEGNAIKIKTEARENLIKNIDQLKGFEYFIRINNPNSIHYEEDKKVINFLFSSEYKPEGIVIPKTNSFEDIKIVSDYIKQENHKIIPLIETKKGIANLEEILEHKNISSIIFGHHDYFYDLQVFPIPNSIIDSKLYRKVVNEISQKLNGKDIEFIDGIHPLLDDAKGLKDSLQYLFNLEKTRALGKLSIHPKQIETILNFSPTNDEVILYNKDELDNKEKLVFAKEIINCYEDRIKDRGITKMGNRYISPQMYLQAKKDINEME
jgi:citrate lyase subunit beta/citryl-CoA lyase